MSFKKYELYFLNGIFGKIIALAKWDNEVLKNEKRNSKCKCTICNGRCL